LIVKPGAVPGDLAPIQMSISKFDGAIVSLTGSGCRVAPGAPGDPASQQFPWDKLS
jgi:hypothetical protein